MIPQHCPSRRSTWCALIVLLCLFAAGCGSDGEPVATVTGRVTDKGNPIKVDSKGILRIEFLQFNGDAGQRQVRNASSADLDVDGNYRVELPPGKYAIHINHQPEYRGPNVLEPVFHGVESPLVKQVDEDLELNIEIDEYRQKQ